MNAVYKIININCTIVALSRMIFVRGISERSIFFKFWLKDACILLIYRYLFQTLPDFWPQDYEKSLTYCGEYVDRKLFKTPPNRTTGGVFIYKTMKGGHFHPASLRTGFFHATKRRFANGR